MKLVKRFPVSFFIVAAFVITYGLGIAAFLTLRKVGSSLGVDLRWVAEMLLKFGPTLAGLLTIALTLGSAGVKDLIRRCVRWRAPVLLYAIAILLQPTVFVIALVMSGHAADLRAIDLVAAIGVFSTQLVVVVLLGGGLGEELGWRGFMLPKLLENHTPLVASLLIAIAWFAWHVPAYVLFNKGADDPLLPFAVFLVPFSVLQTWLSLRSNLSLILPILLHGSVNASYYALQELTAGVTEAPGFQPTFDWWLAGIWCVLAVVLVAVARSEFVAKMGVRAPT